MKRLCVLGLVLALAGCAAETTQPRGSAVDPDGFDGFYRLAFASVQAENIAEECPAFRFNRAEEERLKKAVFAEAQAKGYSGTDLKEMARSISNKKR